MALRTLLIGIIRSAFLKPAFTQSTPVQMASRDFVPRK
jgi:hypothetical protein